MQAAFAKLREASGEKPAAPAPSTPPVEPPAKPPEPPAKPPEPTKAQEAPKPPEPAKPAEPPPTGEPPEAAPKGKPPGPWQLKEKFEKMARELSAENLELKRRLDAAGDVDTLRKRHEEAESRWKSLDEEMRFINYSKSAEFQDKYQKPYETAWARAEGDLRELTVALEDGNNRPATVQDLVLLANTPLGEARKLAVAMFGDGADDVMAHRRVIRELADAQNRALQEARKTGAERAKERTAAVQKARYEVETLWQRHHEADTAKLEYLRPKEGDDEWNGKVESAQKFVQQALASNPMDPALSAEQRADVVARQVAVRNRAVAFSALKLHNTRLAAQVADLQKQLDALKASGPSNGSGHPTGAAPVPVSRMEAALAAIRAKAR